MAKASICWQGFVLLKANASTGYLGRQKDGLVLRDQGIILVNSNSSAASLLGILPKTVFHPQILERGDVNIFKLMQRQHYYSQRLYLEDLALRRQ